MTRASVTTPQRGFRKRNTGMKRLKRTPTAAMSTTRRIGLREKDTVPAACIGGESILLCDECLHADDNPGQRCDWDENTGRCFREGGAADG